MLVGNISQEQRCLAQILTCRVCGDMVSQAHICPNCSKFYCFACIIQQLTVEQKCLNCNRFLDAGMLVNCHKLCLDLTETLSKVRTRQEEPARLAHTKSPLYCHRHKLEKTYYCQTCERPLCSDCSVLTDTHRGHEFIKLTLIRSSYEEKIHQLLCEIKNVRSELEKRVQLVEGQKLKKTAGGVENLPKFEIAMRNLKEQLKKTTKKVMLQGDKNLAFMGQMLENWNQQYQKWMNVLRSCSKGKFVEQEGSVIQRDLGDLLGDMSSQNRNLIEMARRTRQKNENYHLIQPEFQEYTFVIEQFEDKRNMEDFFYTSSVHSKEGLEWRLKIYPNGIAKSAQPDEHKIESNRFIKRQSRHEDYFAIFIEFTEGPVLKTKQKHQIILINQHVQGKQFTREFESEFDLGECWGYEHYMKLSQLYDEGYLHSDLDFMEIVLKICPSSYYQATQDQLALLKHREMAMKAKQEKIEQIRESLGQKQVASTSSLIDILEPAQQIA